MKVSLKWLRDYVEIDLDVKDLAERLTMAGLEVDAVEEAGPDFSGVVVAKILTVKPHPDSEKLHLCEVSTGDKVLPIVCGAPNTRAGDTVALATVGATIPGGYVIKSSRLRGELSEGMLCSEEELGIGDDASGIMILPADLPLGMDLKEALGLHETVLDIGVTPNRADCLSVIGIAREVAALTGKQLRLPLMDVTEGGDDIRSITSVNIVDPDLCPRYTARIIKNVTIKPSPRWMKERLEAVGLRAINNIVDVTNFIMMEMGQPLHAFDFRFLEEGRIVVRRSQEGEPFVSLDEKERTLKADTLMICDGVKPVAIAGIMGGLNSEVKDDTSTILLESAYFNPSSIRKSARWLGMGTDASFRFERGIDPEGVVNALNRAARLMAELGDGVVCRGHIDEYPMPVPTAKNIPLRTNRVGEILGTEIATEKTADILKRLGMAVTEEGNGRFNVTPPTFRVDLSREIDLVEEIARIYGYQHIPVTMPSGSGMPQGKTPKQILEARLRHALTGIGFSEVINYSFVPAAFPSALGLEKEKEALRLVKIRNPLTEEQAVMRTTLSYSLLDVMARNGRSGIHDLRIFEIGRVFFATEEGQLPEEQNLFGCLIAGARSGGSWHDPSNYADFYDLKGVVEAVASDLNLTGVQFLAENPWPFLHPGRSCRVVIQGKTVGYIGEVHPRIVESMDLKNRAIICELNMDLLLEALEAGKREFKEVSKYPASSRDVAFLVSGEMEVQRLVDAAYSQREELLEKVSVFDVYTGKNVPEGTKSLGLRFSYRSGERTLTDDEVQAAHNRIVNTVIAQTNGKIRG